MADAHHCWGHTDDVQQVDYPTTCHCEIGNDHDHEDWLIELHPELRRVPREMCTPTSPGTELANAERQK